jgi:hypothetical protein
LIAPLNLRLDKFLIGFGIQQARQLCRVGGLEFENPGLIGVLVDILRRGIEVDIVPLDGRSLSSLPNCYG